MGDTVLIVDDEEDLRNLLVFNLQDAGFEVQAVSTGTGGLDAIRKTAPAVVVLDWMLPDIEGTEVCRRVRAEPATHDLGILMLTARGDEADRVLGLEVGADDYVVKPFSVREVVLRVKALAKRAEERRLARSNRSESRVLAWRGLRIDLARHRVDLDGVELALRPLEFKLLALFLEQPGRVHSRNSLLEEVWGIRPDTTTRTVDTHIRRLRERLGPYSEAIETIHGFGYRLRELG